MTKKSVTVTLDEDLLAWIQHQIENKEFGSISHAIEKALVKLREQAES